MDKTVPYNGYGGPFIQNQQPAMSILLAMGADRHPAGTMNDSLQPPVDHEQDADLSARVGPAPRYRRFFQRADRLSGLRHKYDDVRCAQCGLWQGARREHPPKRGCDRRATPPQAKFGATLWAAALFWPDFVARSLQIHLGYARRSRLVWAKNPLPRTSSYLCLRPLSFGLTTAAALAIYLFTLAPQVTLER